MNESRPTLDKVMELARLLPPEEVIQLRAFLKPFGHDPRCREMGAPRHRGDVEKIYMCHLQCPIRNKTGRSVNE